jgi:predicted nucleotidyltransferase
MYGLNVEGSDEDIRGIFDLPIEQYIFADHPKQINDETNDITYYEINRFLELAKQANPNILEIMFAPEDKILKKSDRADILLQHRDKFLTKAAKNSLCGYAVAQIKKARGQNKMIVQPILQRKTVLDFCNIIVPYGTKPLRDWLSTQRGFGFDQARYGASKIPNARDLYFIYFDKDGKYGFRGLVKEDDSSNELRLHSIPKELMLMGHMMSYNQDGYTSHCADYKKQKDWIKNRNPERYENNKKHGKGYDSKNLMHCFRLLNMGLELAQEGTLNVYRHDRDFLLQIRRGELEYDYLIDKAEELLKQVEEAFDASDLPSSVDDNLVKSIISEYKLG